MTPAIDLAKKKQISFQVHEYTHDPNAISYGEEAAEKLGLDVARVFKTLVVADETGKMAVCIVPVAHKLDLKAAAKVFGWKKSQMAEAKKVMTSTGYVLGGVSPLGQKKSLPTVLDNSAFEWEAIFVSAGKRGLEIELSPQDLSDLTRAIRAPVAKLS